MRFFPFFSFFFVFLNFRYFSIFLTLDFFDLLPGFRPENFCFAISSPLEENVLTSGLSDEVPQTTIDINLNLSICFRGYLPRHVTKRNRCKLPMLSYSPVNIVIAEHLTEAVTLTSFPGQLINPGQQYMKNR